MFIFVRLALSHPESNTFTQGLLFFSKIIFFESLDAKILAKSQAAHHQIIMKS